MINISIPGRPIVKKNTKRIFGSGKRKAVVYSPRYLKWEKHALTCIKSQFFKKLIEEPVHIWYEFHFENRQGEADVSNLVEGPQDALVKAGVIKDDKLVHIFQACKLFNKPPQTIIRIEVIK